MVKMERVIYGNLPKSACTDIHCIECKSPFNAYRGYVWVREDGNRVCYTCAEKKYKVRKERTDWYFPRKQLKKVITRSSKSTRLKCDSCHQSFIAEDKHWHLFVNEPPEHSVEKINNRIIMDPSKYEYDVCYDCVDLATLYRQQYGFWLRFASEHFIPCDKCQDELHELIMAVNHDLRLEKMSSIVLYKLRQSDHSMWFFKLNFITTGIEYIAPKVFTPCEDCQKKLQEIWEDKELHIGSENKPIVELWRRMALVDNNKI